MDIQSSNGSSWVGDLTVIDAEGHTSTRRVEDASCDAVVLALSLVAALASDSTNADPSGALAPASVPARGSGNATPEDTSLESASSLDAATATRAGAALLLRVDGGMLPGLAQGLGFAAFAGFSSRGLWSPWLRLSGSRLESKGVELLGGDVRADFDALAFGVTGCPLDLIPSNVWSLRPCLDVEAGRLRGSGAGRALVRQSDRAALWLSTGVSARMDGSWGPFYLATAFGVTAPLVRHEFFFSPETLAFRVPALGLRAEGSCGLSF